MVKVTQNILQCIQLSMQGTYTVKTFGLLQPYFWLSQLHACCVQWNSSITDTVGDQNFVRYSEVSLTEGVLVYFL